jgi:hypothetical protein
MIFVGVQLRKNTRAVQRSSAREAGNVLVGPVRLRAESAECTDLTLRALDSLDQLTAIERYRFESWMYCWMHSHEQEHLASRERSHLDELLAPKRRAIAGYILAQGGSKFLSERKNWFTDYFQNVVDDIVANPPAGFDTSGIRPKGPELSRRPTRVTSRRPTGGCS